MLLKTEIDLSLGSLLFSAEINNEFNFISQKLDVSENKLKLIN